MKPGENAVFGVSIMDGYHTMTLTVSPITIDLGLMKVTGATFTLSDQGTTRGTNKQGNLTFGSAQDLDNHLTEYVKSQSSATTQGGYHYPAKIELHRIF